MTAFIKEALRQILKAQGKNFCIAAQHNGTMYRHNAQTQCVCAKAGQPVGVALFFSVKVDILYTKLTGLICAKKRNRKIVLLIC